MSEEITAHFEISSAITEPDTAPVKQTAGSCDSPSENQIPDRDEFGKDIKLQIQNLDSKICNIEGKLQDVISYINSNAKRTQQLEEGYDFHILKKFSKQIIRNIYKYKKLLAKAEDENKYLIQDIIDSLVELLDRNSITQIIPEVGSPYSGQEKIAECAPLKCYTDDESLNGRIASVVHEGYRYEFNEDSRRVIKPAKVILFSTNKAQCSEITDENSSLSDSVKQKLKRETPCSKKKNSFVRCINDLNSKLFKK